MRIRIYWKLTLVFCVINLLVLTGVYFYLNKNLKSYVEAKVQGDLKKSLLLSKDLIDQEQSGRSDLSSTNNIIRVIGARLGVRATMMDPEGRVVGDSDISKENLAKLENHIDRPEVQDALNKGFGVSKRFSTSIKKDMLYMAVPLGKEKITGILRLSVPLSYIEFMESNILGMTGFIVIIAFLVAIPASFIISMMISNPLYEMSAVASRFAKGDFSRKAILHSNDEMGDLSKAINNMADEISVKIETISRDKANLEAVLSSMSEGVMLTDRKGDVLLMNPSLRKMFFIDSAPVGKNPIQVLRNNAVQSLVDETLLGGNIVTREVNVAMPENRSMVVNGVPILKAEVVEGAVFVFHDITELKRLEDIRKDFVANVSHELRTPISSIKGYAETLLDGKVQDADTAREFIKIIHDNSDRLANLINDLLDIAGIESGKMKMEFAPLEIRPIVDRCLNILDKTIKDKAISVKMDIPTDLPMVFGDEARMSQVFLNLLDNAVKYTSKGGTVAVTAEPMGRAVQVNVIDTGIGIPEKDLPRIFERFYRVDKARSRELGGTGLGLSIVKHIIQAHDGRIWLQSVLGHGSTFSFTIPTV